jgi:DNA/RNA-binding domain of Phe-tRNA-synthetase-like protein
VDYLFKVIENSDKFNSDFVIKSSEEIEQFLTIPEEDSEDSEETKE